jgi:hypothetical protein
VTSAHPLGPTARLLALRPPLVFGGHCFRLHGNCETCVGCHVTVPRWAVAEELGHQFGLARWCPALFRALGPAGLADMRDERG